MNYASLELDIHSCTAISKRNRVICKKTESVIELPTRLTCNLGALLSATAGICEQISIHTLWIFMVSVI